MCHQQEQAPSPSTEIGPRCRLPRAPARAPARARVADGCTRSRPDMSRGPTRSAGGSFAAASRSAASSSFSSRVSPLDGAGACADSPARARAPCALPDPSGCAPPDEAAVAQSLLCCYHVLRVSADIPACITCGARAWPERQIGGTGTGGTLAARGQQHAPAVAWCNATRDLWSGSTPRRHARKWHWPRSRGGPSVLISETAQRDVCGMLTIGIVHARFLPRS